MEQMSQKKWIKQMVEKFIDWRYRNDYEGSINAFEVAHFVQACILETKEVLEKKE